MHALSLFLPVLCSILAASAVQALPACTPDSTLETRLEKLPETQQNTLQELPRLLLDEPGFFTYSPALGQSTLSWRGFSSEHLGILINGAPVFSPVSRNASWSHWSGLEAVTATAHRLNHTETLQAPIPTLAGGLNFDVMAPTPSSQFRVLTSGFHFSSGRFSDQVAVGSGRIETWHPFSYRQLLSYQSGWRSEGRFNWGFFIQRKKGDSYIRTSGYEGYSMGLSGQARLGNHDLDLRVLGNQGDYQPVDCFQQTALFDSLSRNYNRLTHPLNQNQYSSLLTTLKHEWAMSRALHLRSMAYVIMENAENSALNNGIFDTATGAYDVLSVNEYSDTRTFGRHARWAYETAGVVMNGYDPEQSTYLNQYVSWGQNALISDQYHSWQKALNNDSQVLGGSAILSIRLGDRMLVSAGGHYRLWQGHHYARSLNYSKFNAEGQSFTIMDEVQRQFDYDTRVQQGTAVMQVEGRPLRNLHLYAQMRYSAVFQEVMENPIEIYDLGAGSWTDVRFLSNRDKESGSGGAVYSDGDFKRDHSFFMPSGGAIFNFSSHIDLTASYSVSCQAPYISEWYNPLAGPGQAEDQDMALDPEKTSAVEIGGVYKSTHLGIRLTAYHAMQENITNTVQSTGNYQETIQFGRMRRQGIELSAWGRYGQLDMSGHLSLEKNRWQKDASIDDDLAFYYSEMPGKVLPFFPEQMSRISMGYTWRRMRLGGSLEWMDRNFCTYSNEYRDYNLTDGDHYYKDVSSKLPAFMDFSLNLTVPIAVAGAAARIHLEVNNITNSENLFRAEGRTDNERMDSQAGQNILYVLPAPMFNTALTLEVIL